MDKPIADVQGVSFVFRGHFNPAIITPGWLLAQKLVGVEDFSATVPTLITPELSNFQGPWFQCNITNDRLQVSTADPVDLESARDLASGILRALPHTPVAAMGINHDFHYPVSTAQEWHAIGDALAPKEPWGNTLKLPGTLSVQLLGVRTDEHSGRVRVVVEPSSQIRPFGIYVGYNDHFSLLPDAKHPDRREEFFAEMELEGDVVEPSAAKAALALEILSASWHSSLEAAYAVVRQVRLAGGAS